MILILAKRVKKKFSGFLPLSVGPVFKQHNDWSMIELAVQVILTGSRTEVDDYWIRGRTMSRDKQWEHVINAMESRFRRLLDAFGQISYAPGIYETLDHVAWLRPMAEELTGHGQITYTLPTFHHGVLQLIFDSAGEIEKGILIRIQAIGPGRYKISHCTTADASDQISIGFDVCHPEAGIEAITNLPQKPPFGWAINSATL